VKISEKTIVLVIFVLFALVLVSQVYFRPVDRDEGFWIGSAQLINNNYRLYQDFPLPHTPLVCLIYSILFKIVRTGIITGRYFNVLLGLASFILIYYIAKREVLPGKIIPLIVFAFSYLTINWFIPIKVYPIILLLIILSFRFLILSIKNNSIRWVIFITGIFFGLVISSRIILIPLLFIPVYYFREKKGLVRGISLYTTGLIIGCLPIIYYAFKCPGLFYFNIVGIHTSALNGFKSQLIRLNLFKELLVDPNSFIVFLIMIYSIYRLFSKKAKTIEAISSIFLIVIVLINLLPISASLQYFVFTIPFIAISSSFAYERFIKSKKNKNILYIIIIIFIISGLLRPAYRIIFNYYHKPLTGISEVNKVEEFIKSDVDDKDIVATWWGGYITKGIPHPDLLLGAFSERIANLFSGENRKAYHLPSYNEQFEIILKDRPKWIIVGIDCPEGIGDFIKDRYTLVKIIGETEIYVIRY